MIPPKKDATTKYVPVPVTSTQKPSPEKLKQESFVYRPPVPKNREPIQSQNKSEIKPQTNLNLRSSGIQPSKISDLGSSSFFKGLDGLYERPVQQSDRSKSDKIEQKSVQRNSTSGQTHFERKQINKPKEDSTSITQYRMTSPKLQVTKQQQKQQGQQTTAPQILVRRPLGKVAQQQEKMKQVEKSPVIKRKNHVEVKNSPAQEQSFTTQTSSYVYKPAFKKNQAIIDSSEIQSPKTKNKMLNTQKQSIVEQQQSQGLDSVQQNIYGRNRLRDSKEVELNFQINTEVSYFKIQARGSELRRSSKQIPNKGRQQVIDDSIISGEKPEKIINKRKTIDEGQRTNIPPKEQQQRNAESNKNIQKQVQYYVKPRKAQLQKQAAPEKMIEQNLKQPTKIITRTQGRQSGDSKGYVYRPRTSQNPVTKFDTNQKVSVESKIQVQSQNSKVPSKSYHLGQNNEQTVNKPGKQSETIQPQRPSSKYNPRQPQKTTLTPEPNFNTNHTKNQKSAQKIIVHQTKPSVQRYPYNAKPITPQQTQTFKQQTTLNQPSTKNLQNDTNQTKKQYNSSMLSAQNTKSNTSGYVYQPPNRKINFPDVESKVINQNIKNSNNILTQVPTVNPTAQITKKSYLSNEAQLKLIEQQKIANSSNLKNTKNLGGKPETQSLPNCFTKDQQTQKKKQESSYISKKKLQETPQFNKQQERQQKIIANPAMQPKPTVYRPAYLQNKKQPQAASKSIQIKTIKESEHTQSKAEKKPIPKSAFSILSILIRKKIKSNLKFSFHKMDQSSKFTIRKDQLLDSLAQKSVFLSSNYQNYLKTQAFLILKKCFISYLDSPISNHQVAQGSRILASKTLQKSKSNKQEAQLLAITSNNKKILCNKLHSIFNSRIRQVMQEKILKLFDKNNYTAKKAPIFQTLFNIFKTQTSSSLSNAFIKLKFNYSYVSKFNDTDLLALFETKNKKISKLQIAKYLQNIYQNPSQSNTLSRVSLLQRTPEKGLIKNDSLRKSPSLKSIESFVIKSQSQKVISIKGRIENLEKEKNQQEKLVNDKQRQFVSKKLQLKKKINNLKKQSEQRKKENDELKQRMKKYQVFNNFQGLKEIPILRADNNIFEKEQDFASNLNIVTSESNEFLSILCNFYIQNYLKGSTSNSLPISIEDFRRVQSDSHPLIWQSLSYLLNPEDDSGFPTLQLDEAMKTNLDRSRDLISEKFMVEQNLVLKAKISSIQAQFAQEDPNILTSDSPKEREEVETMKRLVKNYIKERYLWQWIRNSISKI